MNDPKPLWKPTESSCVESEMMKYLHWVNQKYGYGFKGYEDMRKWSVDKIEEFWGSLWDYFGILHEKEYDSVLRGNEIVGSKWFSGAHLNYSRNVMELGKQEAAVLAMDEDGKTITLTKDRMIGNVASLRKSLKEMGVRKGDRIASFLPNVPEAIESLMATNSIGAIWSSTSPDFGSKGIIDRFKQISPKVLIGIDGYSYNGKKYDRTGVLNEILSEITSIEHVILLNRYGFSKERGRFLDFNELTRSATNMEYESLPFDHPLWILYSSGTTGPPKAIVQSQGGILLEHLKLLKLHYDLNEGKRFFWYTTTGWMMWNLVASSIVTGATSVLYDGSATFPDNYLIWKMAQDVKISFLGLSAAFLTFSMKEKLNIRDHFNLENLIAIGSTGSPLPPEAFRYVYEQVKENVWLASISGGTDVCTSFLGGCPCMPVYEGELQCINLGADIHALDEEGNDLVEVMGEMVLKKPMPSMPIYLWGDPNYEKLRETYFSRYPGIWRHGDWIVLTSRGSAQILGRSDSTLKRKGIRIGTAEIYRVVDEMEEVKDSLIVGIEIKGGEYYMPLFVVPAKTLPPEEIRKRIVNNIKKNLTGRHVPDEIIFVKDIPRTINGKKMEVPIKKILMGFPLNKSLNIASMANPSCLEEYMTIAAEVRKRFG
ncbi:MAG: acetoacetate--CoA ligase [Candidatus Thermoplasmatota archaeon]|jgi:acetoacetyl-CoA synthetase|nr:acetoacetate--CoA ligase [Candidatus Thermoplasmatota archaeon]